MKLTLVITIVSFLTGYLVSGNVAKTVVSSFLRDCYSDPSLLNRNSLAPMSLSVLLDILRKIEDHPNTMGDIRQVSSGVVHLFRQDGIVHDPTATGTQHLLPFSPTGIPAYKNRLLLTKLIPNNQFNLPSESISAEEKCTLHNMISSSLHLHSRGDEEWTCDRLAVDGSTSSQMRNYDKNNDVEVFDLKGAVDRIGRQILGVSRCPMETGVVSTPWGNVAMGPVVTGVSAGLEEQNVRVGDLVIVKDGADEHRLVVNNRYASTVAGDIAETAINQGVTNVNIAIGAAGGWNATNNRKHYFVTKNTDLEFTDAEIRGDLDGLILSELGASYANAFPELKLSQLIDMYYTNHGVFHEPRFRACNRKALVPEIATAATLREQSLGTAVALYHMTPLSATIAFDGIQSFINKTVDAFTGYLPMHINDPVCNLTLDQVIRPKINLVLVTEPTTGRLGYISHIVEQIEVGKFGSSITLMHPSTGEVLIDKTFSPSQFYHELAKIAVSQTGPWNMTRVLESLRRVSAAAAAARRGGDGTAALLLAERLPLEAAEAVVAARLATKLRGLVLDLRLLIATSSSSEEVVAPMLQHYSDFIPVTLTASSDVSRILRPLVEVLKTIPRDVINPVCSVEWTDESSGTIGFDDYVDAAGVNLYRLLPNYFHGSHPSRLLRVRSTDLGAVSVCYSRTDTFPRRNPTTSAIPGDVTCQSAANGGVVEVSLAGACAGADTSSTCLPLYISVASSSVPTTPQCKDSGCKYPNDVKYTIVAHELGCYNNAQFLHMTKIKLIGILVTALLIN